MHFDLSSAKTYCESIGLTWLGDDFVKEADTQAFVAGFTQNQFDLAMRHHLWQVKWLFTPENYSFLNRIKLAVYFLFKV